MLVIVCGPPCTGKSTIGAELQRRLGFIHLEVDAIRQRVIPDSDQRLEHRDIAYRTMHLLAEHLLRAGKTVVLNATYNRQVHRNELTSTLKSIQCPAALVQCKAPLQIVMARFTSRAAGHAALDLTEELVRELWSNFAYSSDGIVVDTSRAPELSFADVLAHVNRAKADSLERWIKMR